MDMDCVTPPASSRGNQVVAWSLLFMGLAAFAPCILLPEWRTYQALDLARQVEQHRLESLQAELDKERAHLEALQADPAVIARLAKRDLGYRDPAEQPIQVPLAPADGAAVLTTTEMPFIPEPVRPHAMVSHLATYLPDHPFDHVFCDPATRPLLIAMSLSLMLLGVCLRTRRTDRPPGHLHNQAPHL